MTFTQAQFERAFNPRVVAVVGDKMMNNFHWLRALQSFNGTLYSVQIDPAEIPAIEALGVRNFARLQDIPEPVDYVVVAVPRQVATRVLDDCVQKAVGAATLFTAGFAETGEPEGARFEQEIAAVARRGNLLLIGPNCMGIANLKIGLRNAASQPIGDAGGGPVAFLGQSGTHTINFCLRAPVRGAGISKAVSFGNAVVCEASDYLEYLRDDPATTVIAMYLEGVRNGRRFFEVLRETTSRKPVVVWKGGLTAAGERAILSHTAALATPAAVWNGMIRQAGALSADGLEEVIDVVTALQTTKTAHGLRAGLIAMTGGLSVAITDAFTRAGLEVPLLNDSSYRRLREFFDIVGGSFRNPLDAGNTIGLGFRTDNLERLLEVLDADDGIDVIAFDLGSGLAFDLWREQPAGFAAMLDVLTAFSRRSAKPLANIVEPAHEDAEAAQMRAQFTRRGLLAFPSAERAAVALRKLIEYERFRRGLA